MTTTIVGAVRPWRLDCHVAAADDDAAADEVRRGLTASRRTLSPRWFYDDAGCALFERITHLPEYYQTRSEQQILDSCIDDCIGRLRPTELVEIGSGSARKTRTILAAMARSGDLERYIPFDVSPGAIVRSASDLAAEFPGLRVHGVAGDFSRHLARIPHRAPSGRRLVAFLGSTIGNLEPRARRSMLNRIARLLKPGDALLLGTDLAHDPELLVRAYDDASGVTAAFNRNIVHHLNRAFDGDADPSSLAHVARWNARASRIEMHLRATEPLLWNLRGLDLVVPLAVGDDIRTEISCKFTRNAVLTLHEGAGLLLDGWFEDPPGRYAVSVAVAS